MSISTSTGQQCKQLESVLCSVVSSIADEMMYSEDDGWEFITLADQVCMCVCVCMRDLVCLCVCMQRM